MIQQKAAELLFSIPPAKRTLHDLRRAIDQAGHAQKYVPRPMLIWVTLITAFPRLFGSLAVDKAQFLPYSREIADQRRKYGESMLRKGVEHLAAQEQYEAEVKERLDATRLTRQEEKERQEALEVCFNLPLISFP